MSVLTRAYGAQLEIRGDGRTIVGVAVPYNVQTRIGRYVESFAVGAFADAGTHVLTARHPETNDVLPIGVSVETEDRVDGLHGAWRVSEVPLGEQVLTLVRDRVPLGLSIGFIEIPGADQWNATRTRVVRTRATLDHVAVTRVPAYDAARIVGVRHAQGAGHPLLALALRR